MTVRDLSMKSVVLIALSLLPAHARVKAPGTFTVSDEVKQALEDLKISAALVESEADELKTMAANLQVSSASHSGTLMAMKDGINKMGRQISVLDAEREALPQWEQQAIVKALPLLKDTATNTEHAIEYLNDNRNHLWTAEYRGYADHAWQDSQQMEKVLKNSLKLAKLHEQEGHVKDSLRAEAGN